ncbi:MAG: homoserine dehydrogenase [Candidatus Hydrothermarchaeales archaeon]
MRVMIIGFGVIGQGFARVLLKKEKWLKEEHGLDIKVVSISDITGTLVDEEGIDLRDALETMKKHGKVIAHPKATKMSSIEAIKTVEADAVLEATPTNIETGEPGLSHMLTAMENKKHVVTSNKGPLALEFKRLKETAERNGVEFKFEASAGGATPLINLANEALSGDRVTAIEGILNGTTNYILSRMVKEGLSLDVVLKEAQEIGIAEADPTYDIVGSDTASKLVILANAIMGIDATYKDVKVQGIRRITPEAIKLADEDGYAIKLIGEVRNNRLEVAPRLIPKNHPLNVDGMLNVAMFETDIAKEITIVGRGAGAIETNSAILSDIISIWRNGER